MSNKNKRLIYFIASIVVSIGIPLVATIIKYDMLHVFIQQSTKIKVSIIGAIICIILFIVFFKKLVKYLDSQEFSMSLSILKGVVKLIPLMCLLLIIVNMLNIIDDLRYIISWVVGCNTISLLFLQPMVDKYTYEVKREEQKQIVKEALNDAKD